MVIKYTSQSSTFDPCSQVFLNDEDNDKKKGLCMSDIIMFELWKEVGQDFRPSIAVYF